MEFQKVLETRRSIRKYDPNLSVTREQMKELNRAAQMASRMARNTEYNGEHTVRHFCAETAQRSHGQEAVDVAARETDKRTEAAGEVCKLRQTDSAEHDIDEHVESAVLTAECLAALVDREGL